MTADPLSWIDDELKRLEREELRRYLAVRTGAQTPAGLRIHGRDLVNFSSNDYLGLAVELQPVGGSAIGWGSGASPLVTGRGELHACLEKRLAEFEGTAAALLFTSGFAANVGAICSLVEAGDIVLSDARNHASIIDGCRLSGARIAVYSHRDTNHLRQLLADSTGFRRRLIVTDTLFSMDGTLASVDVLAGLAEEFRAILMVDEAHATGVFGRCGRGLTEACGSEDGVHIRVGTLSKALGGIGGFVAGSQQLIDWLANTARTYVFSTAAPAAAAAAGLDALRIVAEEPHRRRELLARAAALRDRLRDQGWNLGESASQIIPLIVGEPDAAIRLAAALSDSGLMVPAIRPPSVPVGQSLLRISLSYAHPPTAIEELATRLEEMVSTTRSISHSVPSGVGIHS